MISSKWIKTIICKTIYPVLFLVNLYIAIFCYLNINSEQYNNLWLLPFTCLICFAIIMSDLKSITNFVSLTIVIIMEYFRYVILPFMIVSSNFYNSDLGYVIPTYDSSLLASIIMSIELFAETITLKIVIKKISLVSFQNSKKCINNRDNSSLVIIISIAMIIFVIIRCLISNCTIRLSFFMISLPFNDRILVIGEYILQCASALLYFGIISRLFTIYNAKQTGFLSIILLSILWIGISFGDVRMSYIIKAITVYCIFKYNLSSHLTKMIVIPLVLVSLGSIILLTIFDDTASTATFYFTATSTQKSTYAGLLQRYFAGPYNIASAIDVAKNYPLTFGDKFLQIYTDFFANVFPLSENLPLTKSSYLFNYQLHGGLFARSSQIIPLLGQGYIYFGELFCFIPTCIIILLIGRLEVSSRNRIGNSCYKMILTYALVILSFFRMYGLSIIAGQIINIIFAGVIISYLQEKVRIIIHK